MEHPNNPEKGTITSEDDSDELIWKFAFKGSIELRNTLEKIAKVKYRGVSMSHAIRLLIEDAGVGLG